MLSYWQGISIHASYYNTCILFLYMYPITMVLPESLASMGIPMSIPMGIPIGLPMDIPMGIPMGIPLGTLG